MKALRLPILATGFATCMVAMVLFLACVLLWAVSHHPAMHILLPHLLIGFPAITATGIIAGLLGSLIIGNLAGMTFAVSSSVVLDV